MKYIVQKISDNNINNITNSSDYLVVSGIRGEEISLSLDGNQFLAEGDDNLEFPIASIILSGNPPVKQIYVIESLPKVTHYNQLISEKTALINEIKTFDFHAANQIPLIKILRKVGRLRQIETLLSEF